MRRLICATEEVILNKEKNPAVLFVIPSGQKNTFHSISFSLMY